jgi:hypothetical protein
MDFNSLKDLFIAGIIVTLTLFLPLTAFSYFFFRRDRSNLEAKRILKILNVDEDYRHVYAIDEARPCRVFLALAFSVGYASVITVIGLGILLLAPEKGFGEFSPLIKDGSNIVFPATGSRLVFGMAFLGAYVWGLQYIFQRYSQNDVLHTIYLSLGLRMIFASLIAMIAFNASGFLINLKNNGAVPEKANELVSNVWPALAFLIGMFPQRGLRWLSERLPIFASSSHPSVRDAPLEMIEGIGSHDSLRLEELGIETCYDLATADFVPLTLRTPYSARQLVDWILQAKLCSCFGDGVVDLRKHGVRLITDLEQLSDEDIEKLSTATVVTQSALKQARETVRMDEDIKRMRRVSQQLSQYTHLDELDRKLENAIAAKTDRILPAKSSEG